MENMENKGEPGKYQTEDSKHSIYDSKSFFSQTNDSKHSILQHLATVEKITTKALGQHDPLSAQDCRRSSDLWRPDSRRMVQDNCPGSVC